MRGPARCVALSPPCAAPPCERVTGWEEKAVRRTIPLTLAAVATGALVAPASADAGRLTCGAAVTDSVVLQEDITGCDGPGLLVAADDVLIDLNGHSIVGTSDEGADCPSAPACTAGVDNRQGHDGLRVRGGTISGFSIGVVMGPDAHRNVVSGMTIEDNRRWGLLAQGADSGVLTRNSLQRNGSTGIVLLESDGFRVTHNALADDRGFSIFLLAADGNDIRRNRVRDSDHGIAVFEGSSDNRVRGNRISRTGGSAIDVGGGDAARNTVRGNHLYDVGDGIIVGNVRESVFEENTVVAAGVTFTGGGGFGMLLDGSDRTLVRRNVILGSRGPGLTVTRMEQPTPAEGNTLTRNVVSAGGSDGIVIDVGAAGTLLERNVATRNREDGIDVQSPGTTVGRNRAHRNGELGIEAVPGVTDAGRNRARDNGDAAQCRGVSCLP